MRAKKTVVVLPDQLQRELERAAQAQYMSKSEYMRHLLVKHLRKDNPREAHAA